MSSTATELSAIREALDHVIGATPQKWAIFSASKDALQRLGEALRYGPIHQLATEIREKLYKAITEGHEIIFQWLPGDCVIIGNVLADEVARTAHESKLPS